MGEAEIVDQFRKIERRARGLGFKITAKNSWFEVWKFTDTECESSLFSCTKLDNLSVWVAGAEAVEEQYRANSPA